MQGAGNVQRPEESDKLVSSVAIARKWRASQQPSEGRRGREAVRNPYIYLSKVKSQ